MCSGLLGCRVLLTLWFTTALGHITNTVEQDTMVAWLTGCSAIPTGQDPRSALSREAERVGPWPPQHGFGWWFPMHVPRLVAAAPGNWWTHTHCWLPPSPKLPASETLDWAQQELQAGLVRKLPQAETRGPLAKADKHLRS